MSRLIVLGTGSCGVTECYNTCFAIEEKNQIFLVDTGGGNQIIKQLKDINLNINNIHDIFISHNHIDHLLGIFWILRIVFKNMKEGSYLGNLSIYCDEETRKIISDFTYKTAHIHYIEYFNNNVNFIILKNNLKTRVCDIQIEFFDLLSREGLQYGFTLKIDKYNNFVFLGDVSYNQNISININNSNWVFHEAFCTYDERDIFKPYEKNHSTVKDVCEKLNNCNVKNLILSHTEDKDLQNRKEKYINEAKKYFEGNIFVPDDLDIIEL